MALNSVCWHPCISKTETQMSEQQKEQAKTGQKRTNTGALFWAYGSDDFLRSVQMVSRPEMTTCSLKDAGASRSRDRHCTRWACALLYQTQTQIDNMQRLWKKLSLRCLFTCWGLSGFAGRARLSVVRICWSIKLSYAHVQKQCFLKVINHGKSITIAKSNSVKHTTDSHYRSKVRND